MVTIIPEKKYPFKIVKTKADKGTNIQFDIKEVTRKDRLEYQLVVRNTKETAGRYVDTIHLITDSKIRQDIPIRVYGYIANKQKMNKQ